MLNFRAYLSVPKLHHKLLHTELYASVLAGSSFSSTSAVLAKRFLTLQCFMMSTAKQIKNAAGHQDK